MIDMEQHLMDADDMRFNCPSRTPVGLLNTYAAARPALHDPGSGDTIEASWQAAPEAGNAIAFCERARDRCLSRASCSRIC